MIRQYIRSCSRRDGSTVHANEKSLQCRLFPFFTAVTARRISYSARIMVSAPLATGLGTPGK